MDIAGFYDADSRRRESPEVSFGDGWRRHSDKHATYRLSWVVDTGELYAVREPHHGGLLASYLDQLRIDQPDTDELTVEVLAVFPRREAVEEALSGWQKKMEHHNSLDWVRRQLAAGSPS
ncbi:MAG: hypothetical protein ACXV5Q_08065 [Frankiaceae bacterium]